MQDHVFVLVIRSQERQGEKLLRTIGKVLRAGNIAVFADREEMPNPFGKVGLAFMGTEEGVLERLEDKSLSAGEIFPGESLFSWGKESPTKSP